MVCPAGPGSASLEARVDLDTVIDVIRRPSDRPGTDSRTGDAWLAGGIRILYNVQAADASRTEVILVGSTDLMAPMRAKGLGHR